MRNPSLNGKNRDVNTNTFPPHAGFPERIVCLTEETTETLYLLGEQDRIVGISGYTVRPPQARKEKPKVAAFTHAKIDKIMALEPDLVLGFSDLQAEIAAELIKRGVAVTVFNQRSVREILNMILTLGSMVGARDRAEALIADLMSHMDRVKQRAADIGTRPVVYFEEWHAPLISGIRWVSELIHVAGGTDCFPELAVQPSARRRIIEDDAEVIRRGPDIIIGSWCGKKFQPDVVRARPGWSTIPAVRNGAVYEIKSPDILQPGPASLTDGLDQLHRIIVAWSGERDTATGGA